LIRHEVKKEIAELELLLAGTNQTSQSTQLLKKRKEMREVDEALELMKAEYKRRMDTCEEKRLDFEKKQQRMREQVLKFEKFIQENDSKRNRADLKAKQEQKLCQQNQAHLVTMQEQLVEMEVEQNVLLDKLVSYNCYKAYLERVIEADDQGYEEVFDLLNRYETLKQANRDLMLQVQKQDNDVDALRSRLQTLKTVSQNHLLVANSQFQQNQKELESVKSFGKQEEEEKNSQEDRKKNIVRESSQVITSVRNIFARCLSSLKVNPLIHQGKDISLYDSLEANLDVVLDRITDLQSIMSEHSLGHTAGLESGNDDGNTSVRSGDMKEASTALTPGAASKTGGSRSSMPSPGGFQAQTQAPLAKTAPGPSGKAKPPRPSSESDARRKPK
jgi:hypothetical protein